MNTQKQLSIMLLSTALVGIAYGQASNNPPTTRAEVKAQARAAENTEMLPRGEAEDFSAAKATPNLSVSRASVKSATRLAEHRYQIQDGEASRNFNEDTTTSTASRARVNADTKAAEKAGDIPRGESDVLH